MNADAFAEFERTGWERAASHYEEYWTDTVLFVEPLLDAAGVGTGSRLLDVACGPGVVSARAAARGALPVGVDVATAMVERARTRCPDLSFVVGDALRLPFPDASFDAVTMNFGILHVSQPERALAEAHRVLVPGGRLRSRPGSRRATPRTRSPTPRSRRTRSPSTSPTGRAITFRRSGGGRPGACSLRVRHRLAAYRDGHRRLARSERRLPLPSPAPRRRPHGSSPQGTAARPARSDPRRNGARSATLRRRRRLRASDRRAPRLRGSAPGCRGRWKTPAGARLAVAGL
jgi:SAM-dependent methyltransferase